MQQIPSCSYQKCPFRWCPPSAPRTHLLHHLPFIHPSSPSIDLVRFGLVKIQIRLFPAYFTNTLLALHSQIQEVLLPFLILTLFDSPFVHALQQCVPICVLCTETVSHILHIQCYCAPARPGHCSLFSCHNFHNNILPLHASPSHDSQVSWTIQFQIYIFRRTFFLQPYSERIDPNINYNAVFKANRSSCHHPISPLLTNLALSYQQPPPRLPPPPPSTSSFPFTPSCSCTICSYMCPDFRHIFPHIAHPLPLPTCPPLPCSYRQHPVAKYFPHHAPPQHIQCYCTHECPRHAPPGKPQSQIVSHTAHILSPPNTSPIRHRNHGAGCEVSSHVTVGELWSVIIPHILHKIYFLVCVNFTTFLQTGFNFRLYSVRLFSLPF